MTRVWIVLPQHTNTQTWRILYSTQTGWNFRRKEGCLIQITVTCCKFSETSNYLICMLVLRQLFQCRLPLNVLTLPGKSQRWLWQGNHRRLPWEIEI